MSWSTITVAGSLKPFRKKPIGLPTTQYQTEGKYPIVDQGQEFLCGWTNSVESIIFDELPVIVFGDHTRTVKFVDFPFALGADGTQLLKPNPDKLDPLFFYFALNGLEIPSKGYNRHFRYLKEMSFSYPESMSEQRAIAHVLQTVKRAKEIRQRELALENERKAALLEHLFTHGIRCEATKQSEIGEIPESWSIGKAEDVCLVKTSFPSFSDLATIDSRDNADVLVLGLKVSDMNLAGNENFIHRSQNPFRVPSAKLPHQCLRPHSIVFPKRGAAIATNKKRLTTTYCILDPNLIGVEPSSELDTHFLSAFFERFDLRSLQDNTPIPQLNKHNVEAVQIPLPPKDEQRLIGEVSVTANAKISTMTEEIEKFQELFDALLDGLMTGQVGVGRLIDGGPAE